MSRRLAVVLAAIVLSGLLTGLLGWFIARSGDAQLMLDVWNKTRSGQSVAPDQADALWAAMERGRFRGAWLYCPAIAILVGGFTGVLSPKRSWQDALAGVAPFSLFFSIGISGPLRGIGFLILYLAIAALGAWSVARAVRTFCGPAGT